MLVSLTSFRRWPAAVTADRVALARLLCCLAVIGIELAVLVAVLPETINSFRHVDTTTDFSNFYGNAGDLEMPGLYSPMVSLLVYPLTFLGLTTAYRVYFAIGVLALAGVAYLAQRQVTTPEARIALALGVLSVPQMHWALRIGHFTPILALALLGGFLLLSKRPVLAGLCFAVLLLKPQYAPVPLLYLLWTRNGRALAAMTAGALVISFAGFAAIGFGEIGPYLSRFFDWGGDSSDNLSPVQQAWQYAWPGFLISAGIKSNPLIVFDLIALSAGVVWLAWARGGRTVGAAAAALGVLLITPYANFYDWGLVIAGAVLLLRADVRGKPMLPVLAFGLYLALVASQRATPFSPGAMTLGFEFVQGATDAPALTQGVYWITPLVLAVVAYLVVAARQAEATIETVATPQRLQPRVLAGAALLVAAAFIGHVAPFGQAHDPYAPSQVLKSVPADFPLPSDSRLASAGKGEELPYHLEWRSNEPVSEVAGIYRHLVTGGNWELMLDEEAAPSYRVRIARFSPYGEMTHWAMLDVSEGTDGSQISLELFSVATTSLIHDK